MHLSALLWTAPELLRQNDNIGSKEGDIYSFAIICSELVTRKSAYNIDELEETTQGEIFFKKQWLYL